MRDENGSATTLAIFVIFVILCSAVALYTFEAGYLSQQRRLEQRMATDTIRAVAASVEDELNSALSSAVEAGMYESGGRGENSEMVEARLREYFNERIAAGWLYSSGGENIYTVQVPASDENSLLVEWLPDGSLRAHGYLGGIFEHRVGVSAYGVELDIDVTPRYVRLLNVAYRHYAEARTLPDEALENFENELNENYACECMRFEIDMSDGHLSFVVYDSYAGRAISA